MAASYVTVAELRSNLGIGQLYSDSLVEEVCQTAEDLLNQYLWFNKAPVVGASLTSNVATVMLANPGIFSVGESVSISGSGATFNGTFTITGTIPWTTGTTQSLPVFYYQWASNTYPQGYSFIQFAKTASNVNFRRVLPYGSCLGADYKTNTYATTPAIREAAMMLAVDIYQARQAPQGGGNGIDFQPGPYKMGRSLYSRISGIIAPYANPNGMVG
jgi:hypothetical protein